MDLFSNQRVKGFLKTKGRILMNGDNEEILLRGWGAGSWNNPEGFMIGGPPINFAAAKSGHYIAAPMDRGRTMNQTIIEMCGPEYAEKFWPRWFRNHLGERDIQAMAEYGYNSVRLPVSARTFLYEEPGFRFNEDSFQMLDEILGYCEKHKIYAVLDMHGAPGGQSGLSCDDGIDNIPHMFLDEENWERTLILWEEFARRYKDRWIVAAYELLNEPISVPRWDHLIPELLRFYEECIARIRKIDKQHAIVLGGNRFNWAVDLFNKNFDPECSNWFIAFHRYGGSPEPKTIHQYVSKSIELNVPMWMGEGGGSPEWISTFSELAAEYHIGTNLWAWKAAMGDFPSPCTYKLPKDWQLVRDYYTGGTKPGYEKSRQIWDEVLENIKFENCILDDSVHRFYNRKPSSTLPAVSYNALPGRGKSFYGQYHYSNLLDFRLADEMKIIYDPDQQAPDKSPQAVVFGDKHVMDPAGQDWHNLSLELRQGEFVTYTIRNVNESCQLILEYFAAGAASLFAEADGKIVGTLTVTTETGKHTVEIGQIPASEAASIKLAVTDGTIVLKRLVFENR
ncbi:hypothetical protein BK133_01230 [Paenibacillus sp. FSL H8-0548]|uniref:glycoside hydrolase family 5 protein n=1 Tax=Paenibacillus sp. FSL H8-0548 TaxID=1920422 RepID=UPI00096BF180|nr:cellulase family glycosylhydrolase [Paenibacillus sp. FSL H8-0548]OMF38851.1 hypothetical protein BK133_01230 [Paenibacillus sp. FSL H8-0548]